MIFLKPPASVNPQFACHESRHFESMNPPEAQPVIGQELLDKTSAVEETSGFTTNEKPAAGQNISIFGAGSSSKKCQGFETSFLSSKKIQK